MSSSDETEVRPPSRKSSARRRRLGARFDNEDPPGMSTQPSTSRKSDLTHDSSSGSELNLGQESEILETQLARLLGGNSKKKEYVIHDAEEYYSLLTEIEARERLKVNMIISCSFFGTGLK